MRLPCTGGRGPLCFNHCTIRVVGGFRAMDEAKYLVGIDLGTSNCAMAYVELARGQDAPVIDFQIPQLVRAGERAALPLLPSCIYLPGSHELPPESTRMPWDNESAEILGEFARW